jgi:hypothetical protein
MPELLLAMDAQMEWVRATNPFGGGGKPANETPEAKAARIKASIRSRSGK